MNIVKLSSEPQIKHVVVGFSYEEIRDIANGLYEVSKTSPKYLSAYTKAKTLFDLVKEGNIQRETADSLFALNHKEDAAANKDDWIYELVQEAHENIEKYITRNKQKALDRFANGRYKYTCLRRYKTGNGFANGQCVEEEKYNTETKTWNTTMSRRKE